MAPPPSWGKGLGKVGQTQCIHSCDLNPHLAVVIYTRVGPSVVG